MHRNAKLAFLGLTALMAIAGVIAWSLRPRINPGQDIKPVPKNAPTLDKVDIEKILRVEQFRVIRHVNDVPQVVRESFSNFAGVPFDLSDPGEEMSTDEIIPGRSSRQLVFLGLSDDSAVLYYLQGGYASSYNAVIFWFGDGGHAWGGTLEHGPSPDNISGMRAAIQNGRFRTWESRK